MTDKIDKVEPENQNNEWKESWHDEYFKWLCGYANVGGGHLFIGVNDDGYVVGLKNFRRLLEELPNQIKTKMGIIASVLYHSAERRGVNIRYGTDGTDESNQKIPPEIRNRDRNLYAAGRFVPKDEQQQKKLDKWEAEEPVIVNADGTLDYLEIVVEPYPHMVSCDGKVYKRSGSTLQELNGIELEKFVLQRSGKTWDEIVIPSATVDSLDDGAFDLFRKKAMLKGRRKEAQANESNEAILRDLDCLDSEGHLCRAALLFFHPDPEKYVTGAFIKIGFFGKPGEFGENTINDVLFHDTVNGPFIKQIDEAVDLVYTKYMRPLISYDGLQRKENYFWPREAFREVLLNAVNNKEYQTGNPIQVKVYNDRITVFNEGHWPVSRLAVEDVYKEHSSYPANPRLASLFFASGEIEAWGSGFDKIREECEKYGAPLPVIEIGEGKTPDKGVIVHCNASEKYLKLFRGEGKREDRATEAAAQEQADPSVERMLEILSAKLDEKDKKKILPIVEHLKSSNTITTAEAKEITGKSKDTVLRMLKKLMELDVIEKQGDSVGTVYIRK